MSLSHFRRPGLVLAALGLSLWARAALAVDEQGHFAIEGAGLFDCKTFVAARDAQSSDYHRLLGWLEGFSSAANLYERGTFDITPWQTTGLLAVILDNHCRANPNDRFANVVQRLLGTFMEERLQSESPTVEVALTEGESQVLLYQDVMRKAQIALAKQGYYKSLPNGQYNAKTKQAFAAFQASQGLKATGLPDQVTLWKLLAP